MEEIQQEIRRMKTILRVKNARQMKIWKFHRQKSSMTRKRFARVGLQSTGTFTSVKFCE